VPRKKEKGSFFRLTRTQAVKHRSPKDTEKVKKEIKWSARSTFKLGLLREGEGRGGRGFRARKRIVRQKGGIRRQRLKGLS